jgi:hypothetical protein
MRITIASEILAAGMAALLSGSACAPASAAVIYAHCAGDSHTEAFPANPHPRRAYACRSNQRGFLSPPRDEPWRMRPL